MDPYIGEIRMLPFANTPKDWVSCNGQRLLIKDYMVLFTVIGTVYGGDGETYFNLPDMRGRGPIGMGQGAGLTEYSIGTKAGAEKPVVNDAQGGVGVLHTNGGPAGEQQPTVTGMHSIMQPAMPLNFIMSLTGYYPSRP
jgi:microcystin-dependent protein